jgi:hypothetical protein
MTIRLAFRTLATPLRRPVRPVVPLLALCALFVLGLGAAPTALTAQPVGGAVFPLSTCKTCTQSDPVVAGNTAGDFAAAWNAVTDVVQQDVFGRFFSPAAAPFTGILPVGPLAEASAPQFDAAAAADQQGNFIVAWAALAGGQSTVQAQRFTRRGRPLGAAIEVASDPAAGPVAPADSLPAVVGTPDGGFVVAWIALTASQPGAPPRVMARFFDADGVAEGAAILVSTGLALANRPSLCVSATGRLHVAWTFANTAQPFQASLAGVVLRRLAPGGVPIGPEQVVAPALAAESSAAITCGPGNTFVVAWQTDQAPAAAGSDIVAQRFTRLARAVGAPFLVNQATDQDQKNPAIFHDPTGAFVVVWEGTPNGVNSVRGRRYADSGAPLSDEFVIYRGLQGDVTTLRPSISGVGAGASFVVALNGPQGVVGRAYTVGGAAAGAGKAAAPGEEDEDETAAVTGNGSGESGLWRR